MPSPISVYVSASGDDAYNYGTTIKTSETGLWMGSYYNGLSYVSGDTGMRFLGITIPAGAIITNAYIRFKSYGGKTVDGVKLLISAQQSNAADAFSTSGNFTGRTLTTAAVAWEFDTDWGSNTKHDTPDISSVIQELVDDYSGLSSANIVIFVKNNGSSTNAVRAAASYDHATYTEPYLYIEYTERNAPTVTTQAVSDIDKTTATGNGNVTSDGGDTVTERGVCYCLASHGTPDTSDDKDTAAGTTGAFTTSMTGLTASTDYHARAYATNSIGTSYGELVEFTTDISATYVEIVTSDILSGTSLPATGFNGQTFLDSDLPGAYIWIP